MRHHMSDDGIRLKQNRQCAQGPTFTGHTFAFAATTAPRRHASSAYADVTSFATTDRPPAHMVTHSRMQTSDIYIGRRRARQRPTARAEDNGTIPAIRQRALASFAPCNATEPENYLDTAPESVARRCATHTPNPRAIKPRPHRRERRGSDRAPDPPRRIGPYAAKALPTTRGARSIGRMPGSSSTTLINVRQ